MRLEMSRLILRSRFLGGSGAFCPNQVGVVVGNGIGVVAEAEGLVKVKHAAQGIVLLE